MKAQVGTGIVGVATQDPQPVDAHRPTGVDSHRTPQSAGVPRWVDHVRVLKGAGDVALRGALALGRAGHFDGEHMVRGQPGKLGDFEGVGEKVALRVAQVGAVEPHVGLVEDAFESDEAALAGAGWGEVEVVAVHQRAVAGGELGSEAPVAGNGDLSPRGIVVVETHRAAAHLVVCHARHPPARQLHGVDCRRRAGSRADLIAGSTMVCV